MSSDDPGDRRSQMLSEVLRLHLIEGWSARAIARHLGISRNTVRHLLGRGKANRRQRPSADRGPRESMLAPYDAAIRKLLDEAPEIKAPAVVERLRPLGYKGGITIVRDLLRRIRPRTPREPFLTLDFHPGAAMQVDWADFGFAIPGCARRVSALVMALCYSRYLYLEFTLSQAFGTLVRAMDRGLRFFGGVTTVDIFDNMKTVVLKHGPPTVFNQRFLAYSRARGFGVVACRPKRGNEKGRVERPIGFVRERFWPGRRFTDLLDLNRQAATWRDDIANNREHEVTNKVPALVFSHEERAVLKPLMDVYFETDDIDSYTVTKRFRVHFDRNDYSVPPRLVGQTVVIRANDELVAVYLGPKQVALHRRSFGIGEDIEHTAHRKEALELKPRAAGRTIPPSLERLGQAGTTYFKTLAAGCRSLQRETTRLVLLVELFGEKATASAIEEVMRTGHVGVEYVEYVLRHKRGLVPSAAPLRLGDPELDNINFEEPDLSVYDVLVPSPKTRDPGAPPPEHEP
ncbi:MAG: IS21 family transposase [Polyangiaceae bacterium]|nr:IS21 family transposase [Polyangiaceae bacterium]